MRTCRSKRLACFETTVTTFTPFTTKGSAGPADPAITQAAQREQRILVTLDLDFADIRHYLPSAYSGIIVPRLAWQDRDSVLMMIPRLLEMLHIEPVARRLWIVDESRTRIREA